MTIDKIIEFEDMTDEQKMIVAAGYVMGGTFPSGLSKEELVKWITENLCS